MKLQKCLLYVSILLIFLVLMIPSSAQQQEEVHLNYACGASTISSWFAYHTAVWQLFDAAPGVRVSMTLPGGSVAGTMELLRGETDLTGGLALAVMYQMSHGLGKWEGTQLPDAVRVFAYYCESGYPLVVTEASNINSVKELDGKTYGTGDPGQSSQIVFSSAFEALGMDVKTYRGSYGDGLADIKDGRLIGYVKDIPANRLDAGLVEVSMFTPLRVIGFTDEEVATIRKKVPYVVFRKIPENFYQGVADHPEMNEILMPLVFVCHKDLPEDIVYKITKSYVEGWKEKLLDVFGPGFANVDPIETPVRISGVEDAFLHKGTLRYFREIGVDIPDSVIPPEAR